MNIDRAMTIDGWMSPIEMETLATLCSDKKRILEIGPWKGRTTRIFLDNSEAEITCVDHWEGPIDIENYKEAFADLIEKGSNFIYEQFLNNIADKTDRVTILVGSSEEMMKRLIDEEQTFDLIFIDCDHSYPYISKDIDAALQLIDNCGIISGHDFHYTYPGVQQAVTEKLNKYEVVNGTTIWKKVIRNKRGFKEPRVAIFTLLRDKAGRVQEYRNRINSLDYSNFCVNICEGDSEDDTYARLKEWEEQDGRVKIYKLDLGKPYYGSVDVPERYWILGTCNDFMLNDLIKDETIDYFLYLQGDLVVPPTIIYDLIQDDKDIVTCMIWAGTAFYDTWGFRWLGSGVGWPYNDRQWFTQNKVVGLYEIKNAGSLLLIKRKVLEAGVRFGTELDVVGLTDSAGEKGFHIFVDTNIDVFHT